MCTLIRTDITQVVRYNSFDEYLGVPLQQTVSGTCALVSSTVCIEAQHRLEYEMVHGLGTFPCIAAAPRKLRNLCHRQFVQDQSTGERRRIWNIKKGAIVAEVLDQIMKLGGVRTTNGAPKPAPYLLPLRSWQHYKWEDGFTAYDVADLLDAHGPFIGNIWVCPWYDLFDSNVDDDLVYRSGCARSPGIQKRCEVVYGQHEKVGYHSVVCFEYRFCEGQMHEKILDNHAANGPRRWIHNDELTDVYIINVDRMDIRSGDIWYPNSWL
ncbi:hypothetical protein PR202_ga18336 [Eleusine coracana subsp. coracana]|uniref:Uncharacterized protein n=1 Tax=Eleusine coracana subsp. coracana TaxID=191504 RepID=A0AAV5CSH3_ELECO|nr:hypothetical protein QOZ80_6AG0506560 [Eleusine coracana subsp. coracana]GJN01100.1 hypothetical protein PR202_ga18336 [Eleusine coracana subsp. coracana]